MRQSNQYNSYNRPPRNTAQRQPYNPQSYSTPQRYAHRRTGPTLLQRLFAALGRLLTALMNIRLRMWLVLPLLVISVAVCYLVTYNRVIARIGGESEFHEASHYIEIKDVAQANYIDGVDRTAMGTSAAKAMISGLNDKWSYYMSADDYINYQLYTSGEYADIGFTMVANAAGAYDVISVTPGTPAGNAGLMPGMIIESVDGVSVIGKDIDTVRTLIRSKLNTKFVLGISRGDDVEVDCSVNYVSSVYKRMEKTGAGYVQIHNFEAGTGQDAIAAVEDLLFQGAETLVVDIRNNPGGLANEASIFLDYLLPRCELFSLKGSNGKEVRYSSDSICVKMKMVLLVNTGTHAEAEVFAQVIQDNAWMTIMGETTSGSTRLQETLPLSDGSALRLSTSRYITASGVDIAAKGGVVPEYIIYNSDESTAGTTTGTTGVSDGTSTASKDEQLMAALKFLS